MRVALNLTQINNQRNGMHSQSFCMLPGGKCGKVASTADEFLEKIRNKEMTLEQLLVEQTKAVKESNPVVINGIKQAVAKLFRIESDDLR